LIDPRKFRDALACYPTGVTLVATCFSGRNVAMTVNSFASVSLEPPLILWSVGRDSDRYPAFAGATHFSVNILAADQADLAQRYALEAELDVGDWEISDTGTPILKKALAHLECRRHAVHRGGDHDIIVGHVERLDSRGKGAALTFFRSQYGSADD